MPPSTRNSQELVTSVPVREPFNASILFSFLEGRIVPGIEAVTEKRYRRRIEGDVWIEAEMIERGLQVRIPPEAAVHAAEITARLRRLFDVDAKPRDIDRHLAKVPMLAPLVHAEPGIRVPGVWDPFEGAVRAVLGQQVSVARATRLAGVLCERFGAGGFPDAPSLANAEVAAIGLPGMRGRAISAVARRVVDEGVGWLEDAESLRAGFLQIPGLGPWTAEYAAMRVGRDPDAFPDSDWGVVKALGLKGAAARHWAEPCRPWRAYAVMHLWCSQAV
ncbi:MAG: DNA-3-methyladenine glycosylase 2 family protein [Gammaproteobacteria bacterium]|nr:DNA-3-methyladenine glycosylase 2 family protein [Gammaproteobacteria bacterium]MDE0441879.1 DNA-3-methyladenine glycosylase 2 family protein [Gammaproteobacteria bacterium]